MATRPLATPYLGSLRTLLRDALGLVWGYVLFATGSLLAAWVLLNLFVELQPEAIDVSPGPATVFSIFFLGSGLQRVTNGAWTQWRFWRTDLAMGLLLLFLLLFGAAYLLNLAHRLTDPDPALLRMATVLVDALFLLGLAFSIREVARVWWRRPYHSE